MEPRSLYNVIIVSIVALRAALRFLFSLGKMTSLAAQITGLTDRGLLRPGMAADELRHKLFSARIKGSVPGILHQYGFPLPDFQNQKLGCYAASS